MFFLKQEKVPYLHYAIKNRPEYPCAIMESLIRADRLSMITKTDSLRSSSILFIGLIFFSSMAYGRKTNQAVYQDPFDKGAGGADLTRATQDAVALANPALLPWGEKGFRWWGGQTTAHYTPATLNAVESVQSSASDDTSGIVDTLFSTPVRAGWFNVASLVTNNFIGTGVNIQKLDLEGREHGSATGGPAVELVGEVYTGLAWGVAGRINRSMSIGITPKYFIKSEPEVDIALTDTTALENINGDTIAEEQAPAAGAGADLGWLLFLQGSSVDFRLALKVDDIGNTQFAGEQLPWRQTAHVGLGLTFHGELHAVHMAIDYRDLTNAYDEKLFKKVYTGVKILIANHLGLAFGLHHGITTFGIRLDLWIFSIGATQYSEEMTNVIGEKRRDIREAYFAMGF